MVNKSAVKRQSARQGETAAYSKIRQGATPAGCALTRLTQERFEKALRSTYDYVCVALFAVDPENYHFYRLLDNTAIELAALISFIDEQSEV